MSWVWLVFALGCSADHYAAKGKAAVDAHALSEAEGHYRAGLGRDPKHLDSLSGLGWVYLIAGKQDAASASFAHCLVVAPEHVDCLRGSASVAAAKGNAARAKSLIESALAAAPHDAGVQSSLALLELAQGDTAAALIRYERLAAREPGRAEYRLGLAEVLLREKRFEDALLQIERGLAIEAGPKRTRAMLLQTQGRVLAAAAGKHFDPLRCAETAAPVIAWLDAAERAVQGAAGSGVELPDLPVVKRRVRRQRARVGSACPK